MNLVVWLHHLWPNLIWWLHTGWGSSSWHQPSTKSRVHPNLGSQFQERIFFVNNWIGLATCCHATLVHVAQLGPQHVPNLGGHRNKFLSWSDLKLKTVHNLSGRIEKDMKVKTDLFVGYDLVLVPGKDLWMKNLKILEHKTDS